MFNPCIIIPVYNHGTLLQKSIAAIEQFGHPIIMVDDGSNRETAEILDSLKNSNKNISLITLKTNQGKGAAVLEGFREAVKQGFTHALQIDADGQHTTADIPVFLEKAAQNPESLINGTPVYDNSAPKSRAYGRNITNCWVAIETHSHDIKDAMCGFRVYPLKPVIELINRHKISRRMGFDIEIIVRLYWMGVKIINQPTRVIYPQDGTSNFRMVADNVKISWTHTKLCAGALRLIIFGR